MRVDSAVTWPETSEVLISQSRLQTLRFGTRITGPKRLEPLRVDNRIFMLELAETVPMLRVHYVH